MSLYFIWQGMYARVVVNKRCSTIFIVSNVIKFVYKLAVKLLISKLRIYISYFSKLNASDRIEYFFSFFFSILKLVFYCLNITFKIVFIIYKCE